MLLSLHLASKWLIDKVSVSCLTSLLPSKCLVFSHSSFHSRPSGSVQGRDRRQPDRTRMKKSRTELPSPLERNEKGSDFNGGGLPNSRSHWYITSEPLTSPNYQESERIALSIYFFYPWFFLFYFTVLVLYQEISKAGFTPTTPLVCPLSQERKITGYKGYRDVEEKENASTQTGKAGGGRDHPDNADDVGREGDSDRKSKRWDNMKERETLEVELKQNYRQLVCLLSIFFHCWMIFRKMKNVIIHLTL